jgi:carotenoid cleavage dioxygenase-like enzyme
VPRPGGSAEDDGVVVATVALADGSSALVVLDGSSLEELARAALPIRVPYRFHGAFLPARDDN